MSEDKEKISVEQLIAAAEAGVELDIPQADKEVADEAASAVNTATEKKEQPKIYNCPRCTHRLCNADGTITEAVKPDEDEVQEYVRRIMAGQRFEKTYTIHGKTNKITFTTLNATQSKQLSSVLRQLSLDDAKGESLQATGYSLRMLCALKKIEAPGRTSDFVFPAFDTLEDMQIEYMARLGEEDEWMIATLIRSFAEFERLLGMLAEASFSENFWKGAGLQ